MNKRGLASVVATALLIVIAVLSTITFQTWNQTFLSNQFSNVETNSQNQVLKLYSVVDNEIYFSSNNVENLKILEISDEKGNNLCTYNYIDNFNQNNLILYNKFENNLIDNSIYNRTDVKIDGTLNFSQGISGSSLYSDKYSAITYANITELNGIFNNYTYSLWVKADLSFDPNWHGYFGVYSQITNNFSQLDFTDSDYFRCRIDSLTNKNRVCAALGKVTDYNWHYISFKVSNLEMILRNNNLTDVRELYSDVYLEEPRIVYSNSKLFDGYFDEARVFNYSLSEEEISNLRFFNDVKINLTNGLNKINIFGCNLERGKKYSLFVVADSTKLERIFIYN